MKRVLVIIPVLLLMVQCAFAQISTYPWSEGFESGSFETNGWTTSVVSGSAEWIIGTGGTNESSFTNAHDGSYNALIFNTERYGDTAMLLSPLFVRPTDIDTLELSFFYANPDWGGDHDQMKVCLVNGSDETELEYVADYHDSWSKKRILFVVSDLPENFQIAFVGIPKWGYGFLLDDICLKEYEEILDVVETDSYRQVGTGASMQALPLQASSNYSYTQQIFLSNEMGDAKTIYSLSFDYSGNETEEVQRYVKIYMANTEKSLFSSYYDFMPLSNMTKVFSGIMTIPAEASWATIVLETPFVYDGTSNLLLAVFDNSGTSDAERLFNCSESEESLSVSISESDYINIANSFLYGVRMYIRSNVRFGVEQIAPVLPAVDVEETSSYLQVGTANAQNMLPVNTGETWSISQQIFDAREMGGERTIYSLSFNYLENTNGDISRNLKVYLGHTDMQEYDSSDDIVNWSEMTKVYSGQFRLESENGWATIVLNAPFHYNGADNLMLTVVDVTAVSVGNSVQFACSNVEKNRVLAYSGYEAPIYGNMEYYGLAMYHLRSNIRFGLEYVEPAHQEVDTVETVAYLQVGTGTLLTADILPVRTEISWSYSQQIFTAEEMGGSRTIYTLAFNYSGNTDNELTRNVKVYLAHTQKDEFDFTGEDFIDDDELTKVYSGRMIFDAESGWATVVLNTPFVYNGTDNLVVAVVDNSNVSASPVAFLCSDALLSRSTAVSSDYSCSINNPYSASYKSLCYYRNNIRFGLEYAEPPTHIVDTIETSEYLQVGTGTTETLSLPLNTYYGYSYSQQLFASWEMGGERDIYTVSFNYTENTYGEVLRNAKLYMGHTDKYEFDYESDWVALSNMYNVCTSNILFDEENGWVTFILRAPFHYNGTDNLAVAVRDNTGTYVDGEIKFLCSESEYLSAIRYYNDENVGYDLGSFNGELLSRRSNVRFGLQYVEPPAIDVDTLMTDSYLQVGTGNLIREALPVNTAGKYNYSQQIFNSVEMGGARTIYSLSFNCVTNATTDAVRNIKVYMGNVGTFEFEYDNWVDVLELEVDSEQGTVSQVYGGEITIPANSGWVTLILDQPFEYDGTSNLVVAWLDNTGTSHSERHFACSGSILGNSIIAMSNIGAYDLENVENINGNVLEYRSNIRFGLEYSEIYTLDVTSNDAVMGKVSGSGRYEEGSVVDVRATAHPCFRFEKWNDGETANPRQVTMTEDVSLTAIFKSVDSDTLNYDNGVYNVSLGYRQQNVEWGILLLPQHLASRPQLADVMFFVDGEYSYGEYKLSVYQGTDTLPEEKILEDSITVEQYTSGWLNFGFDTLDIDTEMPLWIILSCESEYPAVASTFNGAGYENGSWWNPNGTWTQQTYGAWMIKAVLPLVEEEGGDDDDAVDMISAETIGVYPNPVSSQLYITGIESGETVEIYSIVGTMVATFKYNGDAVDVEDLPAGMYVIRSNGRIVKFVKE